MRTERLTTIALRELFRIPLTDIGRYANVEVSRCADYFGHRSVAKEKADKIEQSVRDIALVLHKLRPLKIDTSDPVSISIALEDIITNDREAALEELRVAIESVRQEALEAVQHLK